KMRGRTPVPGKAWVMAPEVALLVEAALRGDHRSVRQACATALADGYDVADLVVEVLAPVQREVGRRWLVGEATVADEHRATAGLDSILAAVELDLPPSTRRGPVICVCAEGEWHAAAARMMALVMVSRGWPVVFLGPSLPAADLAAVARETDAAAVAVSAGTVAALPGVARCVRAVSEAGRPVLVGGHAFLAVPAAAQALGAPLFADPRDAAGAVETLPLARAPVGLGEQEVLALDAVEPHLVRRTAEALRSRHGVDPAGRPALHEAAGYVVGFARAAILLRDRSVVSSHLGWLEAFVSSRGLGISGPDLLEGLDVAGREALEDPCLLHDVLAD
ncbi:MAG TPA: B12-binding domain-containing protein, partial [Actinomycetes bacterium]|nr:B12-binding domain-containing protein [Actinomycetes bacterium]